MSKNTARSTLTAVAVAMAASAISAHTQERLINGLFVGTKDGPVELIAYAEELQRGNLKMVGGSLEDAPIVREITGIVSSIPTWTPEEVIVASDAVFRNERAERRQLRMTGRKLNVYAVELRVPDLEQRTTIESILTDVRASTAAPGYAFVVLTTTSGYRRFYPVRLTPESR